MCEKQLEFNFDNTVTIPIDEYKSLIKTKVWLSCLEAAGVDNWDGIDYARELFEEEDNDKDEIK